jgi:hypothetical protein
MSSAWDKVEPDLRRALQRAGHGEPAIVEALSALRPIIVAVERAGTRVDEELAWACLVCFGDQQRRKAQAARTRKAAS